MRINDTDRTGAVFCRIVARVLLALAVMACVALSVPIARAQRAIPDDNLAYPVLVQFPDGLASGFYLSTQTSLYLVTAKHVLFPTGAARTGVGILLSYPHDPKEPGTNVVALDLGVLGQAGEVKSHPTADVAVVRIASIEVPSSENVLPSSPKDAPQKTTETAPQTIHFISGVSLRSGGTSGLLVVSLENVKKYNDVLVANNVLLFGYPTSLGMQESPQLDPLRPLLRGGLVAGVNPSTRSIIIDCPSYPGNSGGPVVEADRETFRARFSVIGVVSQFVPFAEKSVNFPISYQNVNISNSGYTVVTPMDFVLELIR